MTVQIEGASVRQLDELYKIEKQCFQKEAFSRQQISSLLSDYNSVSLAAKVDGKTAGFIIGYVEMKQNFPVGHILTLDVAPPFRRRGVGETLLCEMEEIFRSRGIGECILEVREDNAAALRLYEKLGYKAIARLDNYYHGAHGLYLRKNLQQVRADATGG
ncbi:MAG: ribosomal protein S18-alanine N-acetyltransferase [Candidatus Bathyarchaeia archaeon]